ncbi:MAG: hypothetical protein V1775_01315 [Bacteroidota bacterium]
MTINRTNYEFFIIGYLDGTLDPVETAGLLVFLEQNPDLKEEASNLASFSLIPDGDTVFGFKEAMIRPADKDAVLMNTSNYSHYFVAALEGDLTPGGLKSVEAFLDKNPVLRKEYELFSLARLKNDDEIRYPNQANLKKSAAGGIRRMVYFGAAAAGILLLISVYLRMEPQSTTSISENKIRKETPERKTPAKVRDRISVKPDNPAKEIHEIHHKPAGQVRKTEYGKTRVKTNARPAANPEQIIRIPSRHYMNVTPLPFNGGNRNFYSDLFDDIRKSQEPMLAKLEEEPFKTNRLPLPGTKTGNRINSLLRTGAQIVSLVPESLNGWMLADLGIEGINMLTDKDIKLQRIAKPDGRTEKVIISQNGSGYSIGRKPD